MPLFSFFCSFACVCVCVCIWYNTYSLWCLHPFHKRRNVTCFCVYYEPYRYRARVGGNFIIKKKKKRIYQWCTQRQQWWRTLVASPTFQQLNTYHWQTTLSYGFTLWLLDHIALIDTISSSDFNHFIYRAVVGLLPKFKLTDSTKRNVLLLSLVTHYKGMTQFWEIVTTTTWYIQWCIHISNSCS